MDDLKNPFSPGAGAPPPELAGRDAVLRQGEILFGRVLLGRSEKSLLLIGLRGVGKTVLLNEMRHRAQTIGYHTVKIEAMEGETLGSLLVPKLRNLLYDLNRIAGAGEKVKRALAALRSFIGTLKVTAQDVTFGIDVSPERGTADSGNLGYDLSTLFAVIAEAAVDRKTAVAIFIDELQYFSQQELGALIMAMHAMQQEQLPLVLVGAGLPILPALAGEAKSYAERLFDYPEIGALSEADTVHALQDPVHEVGVNFTPSALDEMFNQTRGYPYFIQEWGYQCWKTATQSPITLKTVEDVSEIAIARLDRNFFRVRYDRLTPSEKNFLRAMAELGPGPYRTGEIASALGAKITSLGPVRAKLIKRGMIYSSTHGEIAFTVPLFDEFMKRAIPEFTS